jgi:prefoldin alpha subunit
LPVNRLAAKGKQEEELRKLTVEMRFLEQTAETLQQRLSMLNAAITDLSYASMTLDGVEKEKENAELLVPIGGSSYVKMRLANSDKVIVGVGAGASVEKSLPDAKAMLKERLEELEKSSVAAQQQFTQIAERINADRSRLETLLSSVREEKTVGNV